MQNLKKENTFAIRSKIHIYITACSLSLSVRASWFTWLLLQDDDRIFNCFVFNLRLASYSLGHFRLLVGQRWQINCFVSSMCNSDKHREQLVTRHNTFNKSHSECCRGIWSDKLRSHHALTHREFSEGSGNWELQQRKLHYSSGSESHLILYAVIQMRNVDFKVWDAMKYQHLHADAILKTKEMNTGG